MTDIDIVMNPDGSMRINAATGTFEEASAQVQALADALKALGVPVEITGKVEQHRHDEQAGQVRLERHA